MQPQTTKKLFTVDEYYRMAEAGILREGQRTELINGEIIEMSPMGSRHAAAVSRADDFLSPVFKGKALVRPQLPIRLDDFNEPEPDICLVKPRRDHYELRHPGPGDVLLILEVSDTSLEYDRDVKLRTYAAARILEVWIEDLKEQTLLVFRNPFGKAYKTSLNLRQGASVFLHAFPEIAFPVDELLGPGTATAPQ